MRCLPKNHQTKTIREAPALLTPVADSLIRSIHDLAEVHPEQFGFLAGQILPELSERDRTAYDYLMATVIRNTFQAHGLPAVLGELKQKLAADDVQGAAQVVESISKWTQAIATLAQPTAQVM